jgi:Holliday junction resolvase RusA-like endonuclease
MIEILIPGEPVGKQRAKIFPIKMKSGFIVRRGVTPTKTKNYETLIKELFAIDYPGFIPLEGPLVLSIEAFLTIASSKSEKKKAAMASGLIVPTKKPDLDNVMKTVADALQGVAYLNDSQIADAHIKKRFSRTPSLLIRLSKIEQGEGCSE